MGRPLNLFFVLLSVLVVTPHHTSKQKKKTSTDRFSVSWKRTLTFFLSSYQRYCFDLVQHRCQKNICLFLEKAGTSLLVPFHSVSHDYPLRVEPRFHSKSRSLSLSRYIVFWGHNFLMFSPRLTNTRALSHTATPTMRALVFHVHPANRPTCFKVL